MNINFPLVSETKRSDSRDLGSYIFNMKEKGEKYSMEGKSEVLSLSALASLGLKAVSCGEFLVILKSDFDVEISGEPYHALMLLLNTVKGNFMARLWNKTVQTGKVITQSDLINVCIHHFRERRLCLGLFENVSEQSKQDFLVSQTPVPRKISKTCSGTLFKNEHACLECMKMNGNPGEVFVKLEAEVDQQLQPSKFRKLDSENEDDIMSMESVNEEHFHAKELNLDKCKTIEEDGCNGGDNLEVMPPPETIKDTDTVCEENEISKIEPNEQPQIKKRHPLTHKMITLKRKEANQLKLKDRDGVKYQGFRERICPYCNKIFQGYNDPFIRHKKFEHFWGNFSCPKCNLSVCTATELILHMQETKHDEGNALVNCPACKTSFPTIQIASHYEICVKKLHSEKIRAKNRKQKMCPKCGKMVQAVQYYNHLKIHLRAEGVSEDQVKSKLYYHCDQCAKQYRSHTSLNRHVNTFHKGIKTSYPSWLPTICDECGITCSSQTALNIHRNSKHIKDGKYQCKICGKPNGNRALLNNHMLKHEDLTFKCSLCGKMFKKKSGLEAHERDHRGEKPFPCLICTSSFSSQKSIDQHMKGVHKIAGPKGGKTGWVRAEKTKIETM